MNTYSDGDIEDEREAALFADEDETLGACGCTDYHMADCPTLAGWGEAQAAEFESNDPFAEWYAPGYPTAMDELNALEADDYHNEEGDEE